MKKHGASYPRLLAGASALMLLAACGETVGIEDGMGEVQVTLQEATAQALFNVTSADLVAAPGGSAGRVSRENVRSLDVTITGIQILPYCEEAGEQDGEGQCEDMWETLELGGESYDLDLLNLPSEDEDAIELAEGIVPVGEYHKVRLFVSDATVTFYDDVTVGRSTFLAFDAGDDYDPEDSSTETVYPVEIPSAENTGIEADIDLVVEEADSNATEPQDVGLLFDSEATFANVIATGNGRVKMPPVLKARPRNQHQNQNGG